MRPDIHPPSVKNSAQNNTQQNTLYVTTLSKKCAISKKTTRPPQPKKAQATTVKYVTITAQKRCN
ncbi:MAG: hypothetical protein HKUEN01_27320 [Candidatus Kuenenia stuttgartiensis]|jgi:hypothetical protein|nr:MAG: hypothetical protein HKUEN01_27320 [Candidatus Kuenenia stuttgartiensis]